MAENDRGNFYENYVCTNDYVEVEFSFTSRHISLVALGENGVANTGNVKISFNGTDDHGVYRPGETEILDGKMRNSIWVKDTVAGDRLRIKAW